MAVESGAAIWVSFASQAISGVALGWNIYRDVVDRGDLRVSCYVGMIGRPGEGILKDDILVWSVTNYGRRPAMVSKVGGRRRKKPTHWFHLAPKGDTLPKMLQPGEYVSVFAEDLSEVPIDLEELFAVDTLSKHFRAPKKQVDAVVQRMHELVTAGKLKLRT